MDLLLAIDIGTGGVRAGIYDEDLDCKVVTNVNHSTEYFKNNRAEQDAEKILSGVIQAINKAIDSSGSMAQDISYLTFDCALHTVLGIDKDGQSITPVLTWEDSRTHSIINRWRERRVGEELYQKTGCPLHPLYPISKIKWWKENKVSLFNKVAHFVSLKSYVLQRITGELLEDSSIGSGSGMMNIYKLDWEEEALDIAGITKKRLPEIVQPDHIMNGIKKEICQETGLKSDISVVIGSADAGMSSLGSGTVNKDQMTLMIGSSGAIRRIVTKPKLDSKERLFCYYLGNDKWFAGGAINNGGIVLDWYLKTFGDWAQKLAHKKGTSPYEVLSNKAQKADPGNDLLFLPLLAGERSPHWRGNMRGIISGISLSHDQGAFIRALMEGVGFRMYSVYLPLVEFISPPQEIRVTGGFTRSPFWVQLLTNIFNRKFSVTKQPEGSVLGAAAFAFNALGKLNSLDKLKEINQIKQITTPDPDLHEFYQKKYEKTIRIYHKLKSDF